VVRQLISEIGQLDQAIADGAVSWHRYVPIERVAAYESLGWTIAPGPALHAPHGLYSIIMDWAGVGPPVEPADETGGAL
jgi:hypothetical protein